MPTYRIYTFEGGHVRKPPQVIECQNDEAAVEEAKQLLHGKLIEVWPHQPKKIDDTGTYADLNFKVGRERHSGASV